MGLQLQALNSLDENMNEVKPSEKLGQPQSLAIIS